MDTGRLLDLFQISAQQGPAVAAAAAAAAPGAAAAGGSGVDALGNVTAGEAPGAGGGSGAGAGGKGSKGLAAMLEGLEAMWNDSMYQEEFSLDGFMERMR
jgi:hypothetical protein